MYNNIKQKSIVFNNYETDSDQHSKFTQTLEKEATLEKDVSTKVSISLY